jgi:mannose-6-phosphate isomerase
VHSLQLPVGGYASLIRPRSPVGKDRLVQLDERGAVLVKISNLPRNYAWGSRTLITDYFGPELTASAPDQPAAEIWFGTHPISPSVLADEKSKTLIDQLGGHQLAFLMKILAAEQPLSIQAHPTRQQAQEGFARENAQGIALTASNRNYKDDQHKPEVIVALSDFEALCGFKPLQEIDQLLGDMETHTGVSEGFRTMSANWRKLLQETDGLRKVFTDIIQRRGNLDGFNAELTAMADFEARFALAERLNLLYPGDPGVVLALLMNHVFLEPGQALFLPAGHIHAYLSGLGIEVMAASDNVLRGGLTPKHVDANELERVIDFTSGHVPVIQPREISSGLVQYPCNTDDFLLYKMEPSGERLMADLNLAGEAVILCTAGEIALSNSLEERVVLRRGEAAYMSADAKFFSVSGSGTGFLATSGT